MTNQDSDMFYGATQYLMERYGNIQNAYALPAPRGPINRPASIGNFRPPTSQQRADEFSVSVEGERCLRCTKFFNNLGQRRYQTYLGHYCSWYCFSTDNPEVQEFRREAKRDLPVPDYADMTRSTFALANLQGVFAWNVLSINDDEW